VRGLQSGSGSAPGGIRQTISDGFADDSHSMAKEQPPCVSAASIVDMRSGAIYASNEGLVAIGSGGVRVISRDIIPQQISIRGEKVRKILFGLAGKARVGKDTGAHYLAQRIGLEHLSFAAPIKDMQQVGFLLTHEDLHGISKETLIPELNRSPRELMQTLGTEWGRDKVNPRIWLYAARQRLRRSRHEHLHYHGKFPGAVFSDVRFDNEATWIRNQGGLVVHILRSNATKVSKHKSESGVLFGVGDVKITNEGSLEEFEEKLRDIATQEIALMADKRG